MMKVYDVSIRSSTPTNRNYIVDGTDIDAVVKNCCDCFELILREHLPYVENQDLPIQIEVRPNIRLQP
jgi:hypothetical protein